MTRQISFDKDKVVDKAMLVFWQNGYKGTSMRDISKATGLNPGSLYGSFGNKQDLFNLVIENYYRQLTLGINNALKKKSSSLDTLNDFFQLVISENAQDNINGCLLVNSLLELATDAEMQSHISAMFTGIEEMFYWIIVSGQKNGEFNPKLEPRQMAQYLVNNYFGLRVQTKTGQNKAYLEDCISYFIERLH